MNGRLAYIRVSAIIILAAGIAAGWLLARPSPPAGPAPSTGIGAFAILYVMAQFTERVTKFLHPLIDLGINMRNRANTAHNRKVRGLRDLAAQNLASSRFRRSADPRSMMQTATAPGIIDAAPDHSAHASVAAARKDVLILTQSLSLAIALLAASYLKFFLLHSMGILGAAEWVELLITSIAIMGGTKRLHHILSNAQKSKDMSETRAAL